MTRSRQSNKRARYLIQPIQFRLSITPFMLALPRLSRSLYTSARRMAASPYTVVSTDKAPAAIGPYVQVNGPHLTLTGAPVCS